MQWKPVPGAIRYQVQESFNDFASSRNFFTTKLAHKVDHRVSARTRVEVRVTAEVNSIVTALDTVVTPSIPSCTAAISFDLEPDAAFRTLTKRVIFPLVGSTPGAQGGRFKTSLRVVASAPAQSGRIVFHPAGQAASDGDPAIVYSFQSTGDTREFDDVVAEMGQSGIGSLDIVPDGENVPHVTARLFNDTPGGTFGTDAFPIYPFNYLRADAFSVAVPDSRFRLNVGFRTLTDVALTVLIYGADKRLRDFREYRFPAGWMQMTGASALAGTDMGPGESMTLTFGGAVIPFYTLTENRTNDPTLVVVEPRARSINVGAYVD